MTRAEVPIPARGHKPHTSIVSRVCSVKGCSTVLSRYNLLDRSSVHDNDTEPAHHRDSPAYHRNSEVTDRPPSRTTGGSTS
jgi:hypothetical protein